PSPCMPAVWVRVLRTVLLVDRRRGTDTERERPVLPTRTGTSTPASRTGSYPERGITVAGQRRIRVIGGHRHQTSVVRCRSESSVDDPTPTSLLGVPCLCGASSRLAWLALSSGKGTVSTAETHERFKPF